MRVPLTKLARPSGALAMVAVDQREALRGMFGAHQSNPVPDSQLTQFKVDVARELSPFASALLVDQEFGIDAIIDQKALVDTCGLIAAADLLVGPPGGAATDTAIDPDVDPLRMRDIGSVGLKFLVLWRNDESPDVRARLVEDFNQLCKVSGLPSIIEIIVKPPMDSTKSFNREEELIIAAREAATWKPDLYKAEVPFHGEGDLNLVTKNAERISEAIGSPWVVLSNGVKQPFFNDAVKACAMGGASGFLAGRAVWADIVGAADIPKALREVSIPRLQRLAEIVDTHAKPWSSW
ncbi:MAG: sulfofructosephosphate aldolase [Actinobacteria bacterium]|nr:sulfofructosephosphate aldolase [Actinomycetota bacterium]